MSPKDIVAEQLKNEEELNAALKKRFLEGDSDLYDKVIQSNDRIAGLKHSLNHFDEPVKTVRNTRGY